MFFFILIDFSERFGVIETMTRTFHFQYRNNQTTNVLSFSYIHFSKSENDFEIVI